MSEDQFSSHDKRIRALEEWRPHVEQRFRDVITKLDANTEITKDTNSKVGEIADFFTAGKVNAKIIAWMAVVLGGLGGVGAAFLSWFRH